jgi:transposase
VSERLDVVPTTFRVLVTRRPRYGYRSCEGAVVHGEIQSVPYQSRSARRFDKAC